MILVFFIIGCIVGSLMSLFLYSLIFIGAQSEKNTQEDNK